MLIPLISPGFYSVSAPVSRLKVLRYTQSALIELFFSNVHWSEQNSFPVRCPLHPGTVTLDQSILNYRSYCSLGYCNCNSFSARCKKTRMFYLKDLMHFKPALVSFVGKMFIVTRVCVLLEQWSHHC